MLTGNTAANDTSGATAWFTPNASLSSLTITYQQRSGFPVYQTWFANKTSSLSGTATLDGVPLVGVLVTVTAPNGSEYTTTTAADGSYVFGALTQADGYQLAVATPDNASVVQTPAPVSLRADRSGADFAFETPPGTVRAVGTVIDEDGTAVADATVVVSDTATGAVLAEVASDAGGRYTVPGLPAGTGITATTDGADPVTATTGAGGAPAATVPPLVVRAPLGTVAGRVTVDGAAPAAPVLVEVLQAGTVVATLETAADGTYDVRLRPGSYTVRTTEPVTGATGPTERTVTVTGDGTANADFPFVVPIAQTVSQAGSVDRADGAPVAGTSVTARPVDAGAGAVVVVTTGADGRYDLRGLTPGTAYRISVDGATPQVVTTPSSGAASTPVDFVLPLPTVEQPGTVTDDDGTPAADASVVATPVDPAAGDVVSTTTDARGRFVLEGLAAETEYSVVATLDGAASEPVVVTTAAVGTPPTPIALVVPSAAVAPAPSPTAPAPTMPTSPAPGTTPVVDDGGASPTTGSGPLAFTGAELLPGALAAAALALLGGALLAARAVRARRRETGRQD